jgi:hypothetical protein
MHSEVFTSTHSKKLCQKKSVQSHRQLKSRKGAAETEGAGQQFMFQKRNKTCHRKILSESSPGDKVASLNFNVGHSGDDDADYDLEIAEPASLYSDVCILCSDQGRDKII